MESKIVAILELGKDSVILEQPTNIPLVSHVHTLRKNDTKQISTNHRTKPNKGTGRFQTWYIMHMPTDEYHPSY